MGAFTKKNRLVAEMIPHIPVCTIACGRGDVADVGCGGGLATIALAQAIQETFVGYDTSDGRWRVAGKFTGNRPDERSVL